MGVLMAAESAFQRIVGGAARAKKNPFLHENFEPVNDELFEQNLEVVEGKFPEDMNGVFIRNGPNPYFKPVGDYHWFDGDGHVHACLIKDGAVAYCNRYVQTARLAQEKAAGGPLFAKFGDMIGVPGLLWLAWDGLKRRLGVYSTKDGGGTGNTALAYHAGRLLALHEGDLPYQLTVLCSGLVETVGRLKLEAADGGSAKWGDYPFTAHPKLDPRTGELLTFGYRVDKSPHVSVASLDAQGRLQRSVQVELRQGVMMHDCAMTKDYAVILDTNLVFDPQNMVRARTLPFRFDSERPARFGLLRRDAEDASGVQWFDLPPVQIFHVANAWQDDDGKVRVYACTFKEFDLDMSNYEARSMVVTDDHKQRLFEFVLDPATGKAAMRLFADVTGDFPVVPASQVGYPSRYTYLAEMDTTLKTPKFVGVVKVDLQASGPEDSVVGRISYGGKRYGGEAYFVPASSPRVEDDGYLVTYVHDEASGETRLVAYSAETMAPAPVAAARLPRRVPYGFHCLHVPQAALDEQRKQPPPSG